MRRDAEPPAAYSADARRCRGRDVPRSLATGVVHDPAAVTMRGLDAPTSESDRPSSMASRAASRASSRGIPSRRRAASSTRRLRSDSRKTFLAIPSSHGSADVSLRVGIGSCSATRVRRLRLSDRRHARRPLPAPTQAPEQRVGHRPPRTHRRCPLVGVPRPTPFRTHVSQPVLDASEKSVTRPSQFAGTASSGQASFRTLAQGSAAARRRPDLMQVCGCAE